MRICIPLGPDEHVFKLNMAYTSYIAQAGYEPFCVVPDNDALAMADFCDGLLLPGGKDIDPIFYGDSYWGSFWCDPAKDDFERRFFQAFLAAGKPIFGICRGFQLISREYIRAFGDNTVTPKAEDKINQRLVFEQDINGHDCAGHFKISRQRPHHYVLSRTDLLYGEGGEEGKRFIQLAVNSMHHQYLHVNIEPDKLWDTNKVTPHMRVGSWTRRGLTEDDFGVVCEAASFAGWGGKIAGVQWHPEELRDYALLHHVFGKSKSFRGPESAASIA